MGDWKYVTEDVTSMEVSVVTTDDGRQWLRIPLRDEFSGGGAGCRKDQGPVADVASVGPVLDTPSRPDRILWNHRPKNASDTGDIDEIVAHNVTVHIEQMDDNCWWIGIDWPDGDHWSGNFYATKKGVMTFGEQDHRDAGWPTDEEHVW